MNGSRDDEVILAAVRRAQDVLAQYVAPGGLPPQDVIDRLLAILNDEELVEALARKGGPGSSDLRTI